MNKRIFLDVGAHRGQTLAAVLPLDFDRIHCFEPVRDCWIDLRRLADRRTVIEPFGLWAGENGQARIFDPGTMGAGLWIKDKRRRDLPVQTESCYFRNAVEWFRENVKAEDTVYLKLNCEGCECEIIDSLLHNGEFTRKVDYMMVDFDARKISQLHETMQRTQRHLRLMNCHAPHVLTSREAMIGETHAERIRHWIGMTR